MAEHLSFNLPISVARSLASELLAADVLLYDIPVINNAIREQLLLIMKKLNDSVYAITVHRSKKEIKLKLSHAHIWALSEVREQINHDNDALFAVTMMKLYEAIEQFSSNTETYYKYNHKELEGR